jgi:hypothetical protein
MKLIAVNNFSASLPSVDEMIEVNNLISTLYKTALSWCSFRNSRKRILGMPV